MRLPGYPLPDSPGRNKPSRGHERPRRGPR